MKRLFFSFLVILLFAGCASQKTVPANERQFQALSTFQGKSSNELYDSALRGLAYVFNSSKNVIQYQNKDEGRIIVKGNINVTYTIKPIPTHFTLTIEVKNGKMRSTFADIGFDDWVPFDNRGQVEKFSDRAKELIKALEEKMEGGNSDW